MFEKEYILCAAIKRITPKEMGPFYSTGHNDILTVELGFRHNDIYGRFPGEVSKSPKDQGFFTSANRYVDRYEAMDIAKSAGQVGEEVNRNRLFSEDLY